MTGPNEKPRKGTLLIDGRPIAELDLSGMKLTPKSELSPILLVDSPRREYIPGRMRFEMPVLVAEPVMPIEREPVFDLGSWGKTPANRVFRDPKGEYPLLKRSKLREGSAVFIQNARTGGFRRMTVRASRVVPGAFYLEDAVGMLNLEFRDGWVWTSTPRP